MRYPPLDNYRGEPSLLPTMVQHIQGVFSFALRAWEYIVYFRTLLPTLTLFWPCCLVSCGDQLERNLLTANRYSDIYAYYGAEEEVPEVYPYTGINVNNIFRYVELSVRIVC